MFVCGWIFVKYRSGVFVFKKAWCVEMSTHYPFPRLPEDQHIHPMARGALWGKPHTRQRCWLLILATTKYLKGLWFVQEMVLPFRQKFLFFLFSFNCKSFIINVKTLSSCLWCAIFWHQLLILRGLVSVSGRCEMKIFVIKNETFVVN